MAKSHTHHHYHFWLILLAIVVAFLAYRFFTHQDKWTSYVVDSQKTVMGLKTENSAEDANLIAETIVNIPAGNPLIKQPKNLQGYVEKISSESARDIVIVNPELKILAGSIAANVGEQYIGDPKGEVKSTLTDSQVRAFVENNSDYPNGIERTVVSFKDGRGSVVGAIVISSSQIFK